MLNAKLKKYIEEKIFPLYDLNEKGHGIEHIQYVIDRSFDFVSVNNLDVNPDMVYTIAAYHDLGHHIDPDNHEQVSGEMLLADKNLREFFTEEEIQTMYEAVCDHRASKKGNPRNIYGNIVSSSDRETRVDVQLQRMYEYRLEHYDKPLDWMIEDSRLFIIKKFGSGGYATNKTFFEDSAYKKFLEDISSLAQNPEVFRRRFLKANNIKEDKLVLE